MRLLQAGDVWALGVCLHMLLSGEPPEVMSQTNAVQPTKTLNFELLQDVSEPAQELCSALLQPEAKKRSTAEEVLCNDWFERCEAIQRTHRSQSKLTGTRQPFLAPRPPSFWENLHRTLGMSQLRRLYQAVRDMQAAASPEGREVQIPGPPLEPEGTRATTLMCRDTFESLLLISDNGPDAEGLPLHMLQSMLLSMGPSELSCAFKQFQEPEVSSASISSGQFADIVCAACS